MAKKLLPSSIFSIVQERLEETTEAQSLLIRRGSLPLGAFYPIAGYAKRASIGAVLDMGTLLKIADTLRSAARIRKFFENSEDTPRLQAIAQPIQPFVQLQERLESSILSEEEMADTASAQLRRIRAQMRSTQEQVRNKIQSMVTSEYAKYLQDAIYTTRQDRFVLPVKAEHKGAVKGIVHDSSASGATLFIEPMAIVQLNNQLREYTVQEREEIERILAELSALVGDISDSLQQTEDALTQIDFIAAKGKLSLQMKAQPAMLSEHLVIDLKQARHPLIPKEQAVASNMWVGRDFQTLVITGPNTGGKTVTLKTLGLLALMNQAGLHIPAAIGSQMGIFEEVFADIGDEQSIEQSLSTFSSHMTHIVSILNNVQDHCLVLFDELGAGTDPVEGASLAVAILEELRLYQSLTVATTHYSELKQYALTRQGVQNASVEFDISTLSPTYRLLIGIPGKSNAFEISAKLGLSAKIIERAKDTLQESTVSMEDLLKKIEESRRHTEELEAKAQENAFIIAQEKEKMEQKNQKIEQMRLQVLEEAKREARQLLHSTKAQSDQIIKELSALKKEIPSADLERRLDAQRKALRQAQSRAGFGDGKDQLHRRSARPVQTLSVGSEVFVPALQKDAVVLAIDKTKKEATVQMDNFKMNLLIASLEPARKKEVAAKRNSTGRMVKEKASHTSSQVDVRGMDLENARMEVEKYLDNAYLSGIPVVTVIHGVGTSVLKNGLRSLFKSLKIVSSFREGGYGEGGPGVTIVEFESD